MTKLQRLALWLVITYLAAMGMLWGHWALRYQALIEKISLYCIRGE